MNVVIVSPEQATPVSFNGSHLSLGRQNCDVWLRSALSGLCSLPMDVVIFLPGCSPEQKAMAREKTKPVMGRVVDLDIKDNIEQMASYICDRNTQNHTHDGDPPDKNEVARWIKEYVNGQSL